MQTLTLFEDVKLSKGYTRSALIDIGRNTFYFIPNGLVKIIDRYNRKDNIDFLDNYKKKYIEEFKEWYDFLVSKDLVFEVTYSQIEYFEQLSNSFDYPFDIQNITILLNNKNKEYIKKIFDEKFHAITRNVGIVVADEVSLDFLGSLIKTIHNEDFLVAVQLIVKEEMMSYGKILLEAIPNGFMNIRYSSIPIEKGYFETSAYKGQWVKLSPNMLLYNEIQHYHPYFNKKLFIGGEGEIKCAPESEEIHGFLKDIRTVEQLRNIISSNSFQRYWNITKNKICICKDCEMRNMCVDNRIPIMQYANGDWQCKGNCNYNPYVAKWADEDGYVPVEECGTYSKETGFVPDKKKITALNKQIWDEDE
jgi:hypothetical protein